jgi:hypothetical protein
MNHDKLAENFAATLVRSAQQMTLQEKRLLLLIISQMRQDDDDLVRYYIPITTIHDFLELKDKNTYTSLKEITKKLLSRVLEIEKPNEKGWQQIQWISHSEYILNSQIEEPCMEIQLHDRLRPLLLNLKRHFGNRAMLQIAPMPSLKSIRLFDILWFSSMKLAKTELYWTVDELKKKLGVYKNYKNFKDFRREVLDKAQRHCAEHSPLAFTWTEERKGKKIVRLRFFLKKTAKFDTKEPFPIKEPANKPKSPAPQVPNTAFVETLRQNEEGQNTQKMPKDAPKENLAFEPVIKRQVEPDKSLPRQNLEEQYKRERQDAIEALYESVVNGLDFAAEKADFVENKLKKIKWLYELYQTQGIENAGLLVSFKNFIAEKYLKPEYRSFENWYKKFHSEPKT